MGLLQDLKPIGPILSIIAVFAIAFGVPLSCQNYQTDAYHRYLGVQPTGATQMFCLPTADQDSYRRLVVQGILSLLGFTLGAFIVQSGASAFHRLLADGSSGFTISLAELLLDLPAPITNRSLVTRIKSVWKYEPRDQNFRSKLLLVGSILVLPLVGSVVGLLSTQVYQEKSMRFAEYNVSVSSIPDWITTENLTAYNWTQRMTNTADHNDVNFRFNMNKRGGRKSVWPHVSVGIPRNLTPSGYEGRTLWQWLSSDAAPALGVGSGLQTVKISFPKGSTTPRTLGAVPLANVLVSPGNKSGDTVPLRFKDFVINQSVLIVEQSCSVRYSLDAFTTVLTFGADFGGKAKEWQEWERSFSDEEQQIAQNISSFSLRDLEVFKGLVNGTAVSMWPITMQGSLGGDASLYYLQNASVPTYYTYAWENFTDGGKQFEKMTVYTATTKIWVAPVQEDFVWGLLCKTSLVPIMFNSTIPPGASSVRDIPADYQYASFTTASKLLVEQGLAFTLRHVARIANNDTSMAEEVGFYSKAPFMSNVIWSCRQSDITRNLWDVNTEEWDPTYGWQSASGSPVIHYPHDSCVGTEFDRLLKSYLSFLSYIPSDMPPESWAWGNSHIRYVPNKLYCAALLAILILLAVSVVALRLATLIPEDVKQGAVDMNAPWAANVLLLKGAGDDVVTVKAAAADGDVPKGHLEDRCLLKRDDARNGSFKLISCAANADCGHKV